MGKKIISAEAIDDGNVFGKVGTSGADVQAALSGRTVGGLSRAASSSSETVVTNEAQVTSAGSQGKYFWYDSRKARNSSTL